MGRALGRALGTPLAPGIGARVLGPNGRKSTSTFWRQVTRGRRNSFERERGGAKGKKCRVSVGSCRVSEFLQGTTQHILLWTLNS